MREDPERSWKVVDLKREMLRRGWAPTPKAVEASVKRLRALDRVVSSPTATTGLPRRDRGGAYQRVRWPGGGGAACPLSRILGRLISQEGQRSIRHPSWQNGGRYRCGVPARLTIRSTRDERQSVQFRRPPFLVAGILAHWPVCPVSVEVVTRPEANEDIRNPARLPSSWRCLCTFGSLRTTPFSRPLQDFPDTGDLFRLPKGLHRRTHLPDRVQTASGRTSADQDRRNHGRA